MAYDAFGFRARAVHTDRTLLATAAYMDWSAELRRLHELRHDREVLLRWWQACEVQHVPLHFDRIPELPGTLPPLRVAACVAADCARCQAGRGGFPGVRSILAWRRRRTCGELGGFGNNGRGAGVNQPMSPWVLPVVSQQCFAAECVTASCASIADRSARATLGKLSAVLLGAGWLLPSRPSRPWCRPWMSNLTMVNGSPCRAMGRRRWQLVWRNGGWHKACSETRTLRRCFGDLG